MTATIWIFCGLVTCLIMLRYSLRAGELRLDDLISIPVMLMVGPIGLLMWLAWNIGDVVVWRKKK